ncbi:hypothetical protein JCM15640A_14340 [Hoylesella timonensis 4401737 = DSM 22865 = JCM 15640]|uniref:hypothetical protein n=1 Tax=Hoylesella timonensis TaxID=386414 RepID=UPI000422BB31|nr:hypothetical protein [Hoylesella timonensis]
MNKILRISVMSLLALISSITFAQVTFDANVDKGTQTGNGKPDQVSKDGVTLSCTNAAFAATNKSTKKGEYRFYASSSVTLSAADKNIVKVEMTCSGDKRHAAYNFATQEGLVITKETATWTGKATSITFKTTKQVRAYKVVVTLEGGAVTPTPEVQTVDNIAAFKALSDGTTAQLKLDNAQVLYTWTSNNGNTSTYIHDATGALLLYNSGLTLEENKILNGEVTLELKDFNGLPEGVKTDKTNADGLTITDGTPAKPKVITPDKAGENLSDLVQVEGVTIQSEKSGKYTNYYAHVGDQKIQLYNGFHLDAYKDLSSFDGVQNQTVKGIVSLYRGQPQINIIKIEKTTGIDTVNQIDSAINDHAPMYNLAGQRVGKEYKGVVIQNGKKFINR